MELPNLGKNCSVSTCRELDFLPFTCSFCNALFCKNHYIARNHDCLAAQSVSESDKKFSKTFFCEFNACKVGTPVEMICVICLKHYCLAHRHHGCLEKKEDELNKEKERLDAVKLQFEKAKVEIDSLVTQKINNAKQKSKSLSTAQKVQLMRLKGKAVGESNIPIADRMYFLVYFPLLSNKGSKAIYINKQWTIGRIIDSVSTLGGILNKNNEQYSDKLRFFRTDNGEQLSSELDVKICEISGINTVENGDSLILEYVKDSENLSTYCLCNYRDYK